MKVVSLLMLMVLGCSKAGGPASTNPAQAADFVAVATPQALNFAAGEALAGYAGGAGG